MTFGSKFTPSSILLDSTRKRYKASEKLSATFLGLDSGPSTPTCHFLNLPLVVFILPRCYLGPLHKWWLSAYCYWIFPVSRWPHRLCTVLILSRIPRTSSLKRRASIPRGFRNDQLAKFRRLTLPTGMTNLFVRFTILIISLKGNIWCKLS